MVLRKPSVSLLLANNRVWIESVLSLRQSHGIALRGNRLGVNSQELHEHWPLTTHAPMRNPWASLRRSPALGVPRFPWTESQEANGIGFHINPGAGSPTSSFVTQPQLGSLLTVHACPDELAVHGEPALLS